MPKGNDLHLHNAQHPKGSLAQLGLDCTQLGMSFAPVKFQSPKGMCCLAGVRPAYMCPLGIVSSHGEHHRHNHVIDCRLLLPGHIRREPTGEDYVSGSFNQVASGSIHVASIRLNLAWDGGHGDRTDGDAQTKEARVPVIVAGFEPECKLGHVDQGYEGIHAYQELGNESSKGEPGHQVLHGETANW